MAPERPRRRLERLRSAPSLVVGGVIGGVVVAATRGRRRATLRYEGLSAFDSAPCQTAGPEGEPRDAAGPDAPQR